MDQLQQSLGDDFEIIRPLGEGNVAEVFLARERSLDRPVAVKVLRTALARDETARRRFLREARLSARIHHPNVVQVYRVGELKPDGRPYLAMEYIDGRTFEDVLAAGGPLDEEEVRHVLTAVCDALEAAHKLGIIHRDVRPGNIMRSRDGERIVLADFGLAGILETGSEAITRLTSAGQILGDVRYAPPEQLQGEAVRPGSDIYALAVTGYELLTGSGPFPGETGQARLIQAHVGQQPTPIRRIRPESSAALEDILLRCLQKRPDHRPSAKLLRKRLAGGMEAGATPEGAVESFLAELKRRRVYKVGAAYGAFILVVLAFVDAALPALPFQVPEWMDTALVTGALAGFPVALILAWFYDLTSAGVERTPSAPAGTPSGVRVLQALGIVLALAVAGLTGWLFMVR
jgi:serine/threonine protein kinase